MPSVNQINLTPRQLQTLALIESYQKNRCYSITVQELANLLGTSKTTAFGHIAGLKEKDLLTANPGRARSLSLTRKAQRLLKSHQDSFEQAGESIPLLGRVAAGVPIEAIENTEQISLQSEFGSEDTFALKVAGDSMIGDGICDGDTVVCRHSQTAPIGKIVVAIVDNENATVKRFYTENNGVRLESSNPNYEPIYTKNCRIAGIVVGLMRKI
ncbi:MAG: transcriptional repressor LexA [Sedimentisphaerales bacterium]|nr:transcriptional repressor LexA [Sedimentisphaerales bacterium]